MSFRNFLKVNRGSIVQNYRTHPFHLVSFLIGLCNLGFDSFLD